MDKIIVLDFGSQYSHLICRRIREFSVYTKLVPHDISLSKLKKIKPNGIIFSGSPYSTDDYNSPTPDKHIFNMHIPLLGICYGHQLIVSNFGGSIKKTNKEYGSALLNIDDDNYLLNGVGSCIKVWMSHGDEAKRIPPDFEIIGHTDRSYAAAVANKDKLIYGIQFHPEVIHTEHGTTILKNFVLKICKAKQEWTMKNFIRDSVNKISSINGNVLCGISGGIDSTVTALLIYKAIGNRLKCVFIDNGLLRINETKNIKKIFTKFSINVTMIDAKKQFLSRLIKVYDPEKKRKIIGEEFAKIFIDFAKNNGNLEWLAQGTLYPDIIESGRSGSPSSIIKTHHNVGGLPSWLNLKILEPINDLYKDEVRMLATILQVSDSIVFRHPFPGPGLAVRIIGEVTNKKLRIVRMASNIVETELKNAKMYDDVWQAYAIVGDDRAVGITGDKRKVGYIVIVKVVNSTDAMTANWVRLPYDLLEKISNRITNEIDDVTWVSYAISNKPPATIEPQ